MSKFNRKKIAVTLAFAALFGNKTSAMNSKYEASGVFNAQKSSRSGAGVLKPVGTLNIRSDSSGNKFFNWVKNHKAVSAAVPLVVVAGAVGLTIWGVKHKSKDNQKPGDQKPSDQKPGDQDKGKDNEQIPPEIDKNKKKLPPNDQLNNPNLAPQQQQIQGYAGFASQYVGQCNASNFAKAVVQFNDNNPDKKLQNADIVRFLTCFGTVFPAILNGETSFSSLAGLKQQQNVNFSFSRSKLSDFFGGFSCYVYIGDYIYEVYTYGGTDNFNADICKCNNQQQIMDKIKIVNMKVHRSQ